MLNSAKEVSVTKKEARALRTPFWVILAFATTALIASFTLSIEKFHLLQNPDAILSCSFNLVLNCSTVMQTWQSAVFFGIPNMFIGLMAFPVLITVAVAALWGGASFKKAFLRAMTICVLLGTIFAYWLFFSSLYVIQVLCPWCLVVTFSCTMILAATEVIGIRQNIWSLGKKADGAMRRFLDKGYVQLVAASWIVLLVVLVFLKFGSELFA